MTTSTPKSHLGRTRRFAVIAVACMTAFLGLGAVAGAGTAGATHPAGGLTPTATPTATTTTVHSAP